MPPVPKVDEITFEYLNLDLPNIAEKALKDLENSEELEIEEDSDEYLSFDETDELLEDEEENNENS